MRQASEGAKSYGLKLTGTCSGSGYLKKATWFTSSLLRTSGSLNGSTTYPTPPSLISLNLKAANSAKKRAQKLRSSGGFVRAAAQPSGVEAEDVTNP